MDFLEKKAEEAEEAQDLQTAFALWRELAERNQEVFYFLRYGRVAQKLKNWEEAENAFTKALRLDPNSPLIMENLGSLWANRQDKGDADSFETAKKWFLRALNYERSVGLLVQLGATYIALANPAAARDVFTEAIRLDSNAEEALYNLAMLEKETNAEESIELLEQAIRIDPDYAIAHQELAQLWQQKGDLTRAEYHFRRSLEIDPADYWSNVFLANLLGVLGRNSEAEEMYRFATTLHPEITGTIDIFARFLETIGKTEEAARERARINTQS